jgi:cytochrome b561
VERRLAFLRQTEALFGYWHAIHKPFAIVLYLMVGVHIGVAIWLGYAWAW